MGKGKTDTVEVIEDKEETAPENFESELVKFLEKQIPEDAEKRLKELEANQEDNIRVHTDKVAVLEVSMSALDRIDGTNGYYDILTGSPESAEYGLSNTIEFTEQGLTIKDRFAVVFNRLPTDEWHYEYIIITKDEWLKTRAKNIGSMLSDEQELSGLMRRAGAQGF